MNNHQLIEKYTKLAMKRLYGVDVQVFFFDDLIAGGKPLRAIFREEGLFPIKITKEWDKTKSNISFDSNVFTISGKLPPHTWNTIVHEISHYKIGVEYGKNGIRHSSDFYSLLRINLRKVKDLKQEFEKEARWSNHQMIL